MKLAVIIPTRNAGSEWDSWFINFSLQTIKPDISLIIDSESEDDTVLISERNGFNVVTIDQKTFNHGGTRNYAAALCDYVDILIFLTQDAILYNADALENMVSIFDDPEVAAVCGRQIPHDNANPLAKHARYYNYPSKTVIKSIADVNRFGLKTVFMSNSFAAYRLQSFKAIGCFPASTILAEDMYIAAKFILSGYKVAYCAESIVKHSHNYTPWEEFHRYFDTGVFHACEPWIQQRLGGASGEGIRFIKSELNYLWHHAPLWIPRALLTTGCKFLGYKLGRNYKKIPKSWRSIFSMYRSYWLQQKY
jgi:rhamnosyltransferase